MSNNHTTNEGKSRDGSFVNSTVLNILQRNSLSEEEREAITNLLKLAKQNEQITDHNDSSIESNDKTGQYNTVQTDDLPNAHSHDSSNGTFQQSRQE